MQKNDHILFYGGSITDYGRNRESSADDRLGGGYVRMCHGLLQGRYADLKLQVSNKGISGNRIYDLEERLKRELSARFVVCEPFLLPVPEDRAKWCEDLDPKIHAIRALAWEFGGQHLPLDGIFVRAAVRRPAAFWLLDGVHPSAAGHGLIADAWVELASE